MGKTYTEILAASEATILKRDDIQVLTQDGQSKGIRYSLIQYTIYAHVVNSQTDFNAVIERVAANQYKFKNGLYTITFKPLTGGYKMYGGTSPLSGGDTWGYIETNQCTKINFDLGAYIDFGLTIGYLKVNTAYSVLNKVNIKGDDTGAAAAIVQSFLISVDNVILNDCITSNRYSNTDFYAFINQSTTNKKNTLNNCKVTEIKTDYTILGGFKSIENTNSCMFFSINSPLAVIFGFESCSFVSKSKIMDIISDACIIMNGIYAAHNNYIENISGATQSIGINSVDIVTGNYIKNINGAGIVGQGIVSCKRVTNNYVRECKTDGYYDCEGVVNNLATNNTGNGFNACKAMGHNRSTANGTNYLNSFADWAGTQAVADTAAGGYNG